VPISVGYQSGSHYSTIQALEQYLPPGQIELSFEEGMLFRRLELLLAGKSPAVALFNGPYYFAEQLGFRKIIDNTFMIGAMINGNPKPDDIRKYFRALQRAQRDIDLRPDLLLIITKTSSLSVFTPRSTRGAGGPASALSLSPTAGRRLRSHSTGSPSMRSSSRARWARANTKTPSSRLLPSSAARRHESRVCPMGLGFETARGPLINRRPRCCREASLQPC
jgi:hypothetical protein